VFPKPEEGRYDWEIMNGLGAAFARGAGTEFQPLPEPARLVEMGLRAGPHARTVTMETLRAAPHGLDLGPLVPSLLARLETPDARIACAPEAIVDDLKRVARDLLGAAPAQGLRLVGRRHLRSNNSWMHNVQRLTRGPRRDQLWIHPGDAAARGIGDGDPVALASRVGEVRVTARVTDRVMRGVVCLPHGFGQGREGVKLAVASRLAGASYNDVADDLAVDVPSGNAALNALPVTVTSSPPARFAAGTPPACALDAAGTPPACALDDRAGSSSR
ncbi:MAG: hypothetical protein NTY18_07655, partial [Deltaproteobacteria bacterium]|nr:hypothetical protein [Deltaproteobacteria bacterium]